MQVLDLLLDGVDRQVLWMEALHVLAVLQVGNPDSAALPDGTQGHWVTNHYHQRLSPCQGRVQELRIGQETEILARRLSENVTLDVRGFDQVACPHCGDEDGSKLLTWKQATYT